MLRVPHRLRPTQLALLCAALVLVLFPLSLLHSGQPLQLKADEPAYFMMAASLWHDGDLLCEPEDLRRLFREFPVRTSNLFLMSADRWETAHFSAPLLYSLLAAPAVGLLGAQGMIALNALLFAGMLWMGTSYLRQFNPEPTAALFAGGFLVLSNGFAYIFWLQPEVLHMACVMTAFWLAFSPSSPALAGDRRARAGRQLLAFAAAGLLLMVVVYAKPTFALLLVPIAYAALEKRGVRAVLAVAAAALVSLALLAALSWSLTRQAWPYFSDSRRAVNVSSPIQFAERKLEPLPILPAIATRSSNEKWLEIVTPRQDDLRQLRQNLGYLLWGRHVGLLLYMPFAALAIVLFLARERRSLGRWLLFSSLLLATVSFVLYFPDRWHGGGGFVGNRYLVNVYPAFLFLATRVTPGWIPAVGYALGGVFLGPILFTPLGAAVPEPTLQAHARALPFRAFPLELSLASRIPGYRSHSASGVWFLGRRDLVRVERGELWLRGAVPVELWLTSPAPMDELIFGVRSLAPGNRVSLCIGGVCQTAEFGATPPGGSAQRVSLRPRRAGRRAGAGGQFVHRMVVRTAEGEQPRWRSSRPSPFYLGAALTFFGSAAERERDLFHARWKQADAPREVTAGETFRFPVHVRNASDEPWPAGGPTQVVLGYHWLAGDGRRIVWDGKRTPLGRDVPPGGTVGLYLVVEAPAETGELRLVLDPVREDVAWFSTRDPESAAELRVRVVGPEPEG